ncbi:ethanolamine ammonia-lyase reactivating factor EutA [Rhizobium sp. BK376]|uniref:ethanolamine ammonia-lyase reactivating factor EutA n=1 Tax=Rhizobium sp. BK376 TaxID=2512149 RepID=UPI00104517B8|nr:ethanolamine ammonia-lyase reactivating factor EutA [Rhizobium sp. BK376]TCR87708.1 reactivating factor of adenosylcobalamin-dependent ethanolamine ammonia lyase [Rhizobium sp. BK376]
MADDEEEQGGRIFFSNIGRSMEVEDEIVLVSVGIDIGSSTSHLAFSRIVLERLDTRYMVVERTLLHQSDVLLTPYRGEDEIDADVLGAFIKAQYDAAGITPETIDTGALILTGVAVRRSNARAIGEIFSEQTGKFVVVSAGDGLETTLAAFGSGAVARSGETGATVLNVDIGGGTSKLARCANGAIRNISAIDIGARIVAFDADRRITRIEEAGRYFAHRAGIVLERGSVLSQRDARKLAACMVDQLFEAMTGGEMPKETLDLHRLPPLPSAPAPDIVTISGGVSEFFYGETQEEFSDLGPLLAEALREKLRQWPPRLERPAQGIRATVVGASQYTVQVSGSTIFVHPLSLLPVKNVPVIKPELSFDEVIDPSDVAAKVKAGLARLDLAAGESPVALCYEWQGSASYRRLDDFCRGVIDGLSDVLGKGHPLILVGDGDVGGLVGMHCKAEAGVANLVSIDGIKLDEFDFIDIGGMLETSGAVPVVIKSLVFPTKELGRAGMAERN